MSRGVFVTGTDTGVGKTLVATALLRRGVQAGLKCVGMKPVAAGCERVGASCVYQDVEALIAASNVVAPREAINPYRFPEPVAPHLAAAASGVSLDIEVMADRFRELAARADLVVVEGAGGFLVPLDDETTLADLALRLALPVVLVVGMRLGCLNHTLLTAEAIARRGLRLAGWVANRIDPQMARFEENLATLRARLALPLLGVLPPFPNPPDPAAVAAHLRLP
ncbi:dethiobiotin synthase [Thiobacter aerophilum]|uniref:ATP-dependent dethiobiotin synthetase BioD n=1 Tax=Thiobacter aerophilum TaxID=3121275 RepID=A0ABV0EH54_9BURK